MKSETAYPQLMVRVGDACISNFNAWHGAAEKANISIFDLHVYLAVGALNIVRLDDSQVMFVSITPASAAKALNLSPKAMGRWLNNLVKCGLLRRETTGTYCIADIEVWHHISQQVFITA